MYNVSIYLIGYWVVSSFYCKVCMNKPYMSPVAHVQGFGVFITNFWI